MSKVLTAVAVLGALPFAAGTVGGDFLFDLIDSDSNLVAEKRGPETTVTFEDVPPGTYIVHAWRVNGDGSGPLGTSVVSEPFTIVDEPATVTIDVPASVTVSVA